MGGREMGRRWLKEGGISFGQLCCGMCLWMLRRGELWKEILGFKVDIPHSGRAGYVGGGGDIGSAIAACLLDMQYAMQVCCLYCIPGLSTWDISGSSPCLAWLLPV
jgi:hypothetical protein